MSGRSSPSHSDTQEVLTLVYVAGFSVREIADMLGKTERAVYYTQSRALQRLRKLISEDFS
jgi:RNA polymerase sigma factor (sigma-70 family)